MFGTGRETPSSTSHSSSRFRLLVNGFVAAVVIEEESHDEGLLTKRVKRDVKNAFVLPPVAVLGAKKAAVAFSV